MRGKSFILLIELGLPAVLARTITVVGISDTYHIVTSNKCVYINNNAASSLNLPWGSANKHLDLSQNLKVCALIFLWLVIDVIHANVPSRSLLLSYSMLGTRPRRDTSPTPSALCLVIVVVTCGVCCSYLYRGSLWADKVVVIPSPAYPKEEPGFNSESSPIGLTHTTEKLASNKHIFPQLNKTKNHILNPVWLPLPGLHVEPTIQVPYPVLWINLRCDEYYVAWLRLADQIPNF